LWPGGKFITANIIARSDYLKTNPDTIRKFLEANVDETNWMNKNKNLGIKLFNEALKNITGKTIQQDELADAWSRITFTYDPVKSSLFQSANSAYDLGFLAKGKDRPNLSGLYDLTILNDILNKRSLQKIR